MSAVAVGRLGDRDVIVSAVDDHTVRVWVWDSAGSLLTELTGHAAPVYAVAIGRLGRREVVISGSTDKTVRVWDDSGSPLAWLTGHTSTVGAVATGRLGDQSVAISGSYDSTVRVWANGMEPAVLPCVHHVAGVGAADDSIYAAVGPAICRWDRS